MNTYTRTLTIAGSDSGGGAGIQADLKTFSALGCYGMSVLTALTAQNTKAVTGIFPVEPSFIVEQLNAVLSDIGVDAIKIGMLHSPDIIEQIATTLRGFNVSTIVLDPVMVAKSGDKLLQDEAVDALKTYLLPLALVITPNLPEASVLLGRSVETKADMLPAAADLAKLCPGAILVKGGHLADDESTDLLYVSADEQHWFPTARIPTNNSHGTGCTLSSAIAAGLAKGLSVVDAVAMAKTYLTGALQAGADYPLGHGHGPVHHFYNFWQ
ncbi:MULTISPECIES: bifunctional hydroxymethylpyrimidine kinase/phosphomethylpyrimidine kinase [unclassified Spirosoma]|uniref:bifunctional hydroxymethylpyrimidine kinase/phosphomethylpyrimidine kinase n=1 Tax=unclassified Spirosoma TaxID=2621999 RepID=UPI00096442F9|nr:MULTISPECIES: bifunctional hydroxymethylpyrimidine kinase/phosphomethylpyrimidine kinase [unclassified Spirosoma]MBN8821812.1 bifunctional hydroxymethylpyrimidine kinase/phosphomethylpyrimidine kinase [Spirosoma sp.]OJW80699.1 MAG: bifunctional hydroxymethylpyrimidine kinase/phosphomethylpyrimidine kinase [Spirosoma sp. 48-14]